MPPYAGVPARKGVISRLQTTAPARSSRPNAERLGIRNSPTARQGFPSRFSAAADVGEEHIVQRRPLHTQAHHRDNEDTDGRAEPQLRVHDLHVDNVRRNADVEARSHQRCGAASVVRIVITSCPVAPMRLCGEHRRGVTGTAALH